MNAHSAMMGVASVINLVAGLVKNKLAALLVGPAGFGELMYFQSAVVLLSTIFGAGTNNAGVRKIARDLGRGESILESLATLSRLTLVLAILGSLVSYFLSCEILRICKNEWRMESIFVSVGVFSAIMLAGKSAILVALGRVRDVAITSVVGATIGGLIGVAFLLDYAREVKFIYILAPIIISLSYASYKVSQIYQFNKSLESKYVVSCGKEIVATGIPYAVTAILATCVVFGVNYLAVNAVGFNGAGKVGAAFAISGAYMAILGSSVFSSYFPKVVADINKKDQLSEIFSAQIDLSLSMAILMMIPLMVLSVYIVPLMFSSDFSEAAALLGLVILSDLLKLICWPLSYILMAASRVWDNFIIELLSTLVFFGVSLVYLEGSGINAFGYGMVARYGVSLTLTAIYVSRFKFIDWQKNTVKIIVFAMVTLYLLYVLMSKLTNFGYAAGAIFFCIWGYFFLVNVGAREFLKKLRIKL